MKKNVLQRLAIGLLVWLAVSAVWADMRASVPNVGNGRLVVCGQNARNYFVVNYEADRSDARTPSALETKTRKMVNALRDIDADIYVFNELEVNDSVLGYLSVAMNKDAGKQVYTYVKDGLSADATYIKSGYMYRIDKVKPVGSNTTTSTQMYYNNTMRLQAFEELGTGERFVLSMNHFKAKDNTADAGESKREKNASDLVNALSRVSIDPDILIMGDLNCTISESPLSYLLNAGYEEQILKYNSAAYSHIYNGTKSLIDHVFANSTMAEQITGAGVYNVNTTGGGSVKYSDHDPYLVAINLGDGSVDPNPNPDPDNCNIAFSQDFKTGLGDFTEMRIKGSAAWLSNARYGVTINGYRKSDEMDNWLVSPTFDLSDAESATLTFRHNLFYDNSEGAYEQYQTLWYTNSYTDGDTPDETKWTQITIPNWTIKSYTNNRLTIPAAFLKSNFRFAFRYTAPNGTIANYWEIDNAGLTSVCKAKAEAIENVHTEIRLSDAATRVFTLMGEELTAEKDHLPAGIYILLNGTQVQKILIP